MNLKIWGASTLKSFTNSIIEGLLAEGTSFNSKIPFAAGLAQIHGSPLSVSEDKIILEESLKCGFPVLYLIHRPDEVLQNPYFTNIFSSKFSSRFVLFGDLVFQFPFWSERRAQCTIIPHPFTDLTLPPSTTGKCIVGSFTTWGEMRKLDHYIHLVEALSEYDGFQFKIGGAGLDKDQIPSHVEISEEFFIPHFNVQLYHLNGKKRFGETSGSLHRGITIPIIFEANGAERIENLLCIKILADNDLAEIDFKKAALAIKQMAATNLSDALEHNLLQAKSNSPRAFARALLCALAILKH